ncbi:MAG: asparagine synthetase B family protein [Cyclonatronaceae bacterium]
MEIHLLLDPESPWRKTGHDLTRGDLWDGNCFLRDEQITPMFKGIHTLDDAARLCSELTGRFGWMRIQPGKIWLAADHLRSQPIFYAMDRQRIWISDIPDRILQVSTDTEIDPSLAAEYLVLGYVTGPDTLFRGLHQVEPGTIVEIAEDTEGEPPRRSVRRYWDFIHTYRDAPREHFTRHLDDVVLQTVQRAIRYADGRPIVLPLSGGYDSRLLAMTLARLEYSDVHCYSYGQKGNAEMEVGRHIASDLGFRWTGIHYTASKWRKRFHSADRKAYYRLAGREAGVPNIQELVAIAELKEQGLVPDNGVIMSGHFGGALVGGRGIYDSHTYRDRPQTDAETILRHVYHYHHNLWDWSGWRNRLEPFFRQRILDGLPELARFPDSPSACESWNIRQRQARFIVPIRHLYTYYGYDAWMPYCDQDYIRFWMTVPLAFRHDKSLYTDYIDRQAPFRIATHQPEKPILAIREAVRKTLLFRPAQSFYTSWVQGRRKRREYDRHPMAWYGIMERGDFHAHFTGRENINSFQSLELLRTLYENGYLSPEMIFKRFAGNQ